MRRSTAPFAALIASLALVAALPVPSLAAGRSDCRVLNVESGARSSSLQGAVDAASAGDHLRVRGTCQGITTIDRDLAIRGVRPSRGWVRPTLDGDGLGATIVTEEGTRVRMRTLRIRGGDAYGPQGPWSNNGGGIANSGWLLLRDVEVRGNHAHCGGGISAQAPLVLRGATAVHHNTSAQCGGGIDVDGTWRVTSLLMRGRATIRDNHTDNRGGGVNIYGRSEAATLEMRGSSSIHHNTAGSTGGGIHSQAGILVGIDCGSPGDRSHDNDPGDCTIES